MKNYLICLCVLLFASCQSESDGQAVATVEKYSDKDSTDQISLEVDNSVDTLLNDSIYLILGNKRAKIKIVDEKDIDNYPAYENTLWHKSTCVLMKNHIDDSLQFYLKYNPKYSYEDFPATLYKGRLADPDFSTDPDAKMFITRIKNECKRGVNFAGHYTLVIWGCGSPCQSGVIVDRKNGKIYSGYGSSLGSDFRKDSKLLIRNYGAIDTTTNLIETCAYCDVTLELWTGSKFKEIYKP